MLAVAGQPLEVPRLIRDVEGDPFDPDEQPTATATQTGSAPVNAAVRLLETGVYAARIPGAMLSTLGVVELAWSWEYEGDTYTVSDRVDVTTVPVASIDDLDRLPGSARVVGSTVTEKRVALSVATRSFEDATNTTFSPRLRVDRGIASDGGLRLADHLTEIREVQVDGELVDVAAVRIDPVWDRALIPGVAEGTQVEVTYVHGLDRPPEYVTRAVAVLASSLVVDGPWDDRGVAIGGEMGFARLLTAGVGRTMFSIPEVEAAYKRCRMPVIG